MSKQRVEEIVGLLEGIEKALSPEARKNYGSQYVLLDDVADYGAELFQELDELDPERARSLDPEGYDANEAYAAAYDEQYGDGAYEQFCEWQAQQTD